MEKLKRILSFLADVAYKNKRVVLALSCLVVFMTTYLLILPAFTLEKDEAIKQGGIDIGTEASEDVSDEKSDAVTADEDEAAVEPSDKKDAFDVKKTDKKAKADTAKDAPSDALTFEGEGFSVAVEDKAGTLPEKTSIEASELVENPTEGTMAERKAAAEEYRNYYDKALEAINDEAKGNTEKKISFVKFYDITLQSGDEAIQPEKPVNVTISYDKQQQKELKVEEKKDVRIIHFAEDEKTGEITAEIIDDKNVDVTLEKSRMTDTTFEAEGFSVYGIIYTVDFHWEVDGKKFDFSIPGGGSISFSQLVEVLGIEKEDTKNFIENVESITFSNPELLSVSKVEEDTTVGAIKDALGLDCEYSKELTKEQIDEINAQTVNSGDWALISLKPFKTEETLTITMSNGDQFIIQITDGQLCTYVISDSGDTYEIIVTYDDTAEIPENAELKVRKIRRFDARYSKETKVAEDALQDRFDRGLAPNTEVFDISIIADGKPVEPAEGSTVSVEMRLLAKDFSASYPEDDEKSSSGKESALEDSSFFFYNGSIRAKAEGETDERNDAENGEINEIEVPRFDVVHLTNDGITEIIDLTDSPRIEGDNVKLQFETASFSDFIVTGSTSGGERYTIDSLPTTMYVGDNFYIYEHQNFRVVENGIVEMTRPVNNSDQFRSYVVTGAGQFEIQQQWGNSWSTVKTVKVSERSAVTPPATVTTVPNASIGVKMNMFDYDLSNQLDDFFNQFNLSRQPYENKYKNWGVNSGKTLKFWGSGINRNWYGNDDRAWANVDWGKNSYTEYQPGTGIVKSQLSGGTTGYPVLTGGNEDLGYLFTDSNYNNDVKAYIGVDGLFQKDDQGYYYYDSSQNYARLNTDTKVFDVYNGTYHQWSKGEVESQIAYGEGVTVGDNGRPVGFFPFHDWDPSYDKFVNWNKNLNHHFGLSMELTFSFPNANEGQAIVDENGNEIVFEFNGDDDMWVFIDGKLCMDIGGIHQPIDGQINFTNKTVEVAGNSQSNFSASDWSKLYDGKQHTLQVFYLERGGCDSNCKIKFNLTHYTDVELDKVDSDNVTKGLQGAKFQLFKEVEVIENGQTVTKLEPAYWYATDTANPGNTTGIKKPFIETTDENGHLKFKNVPLGNYILKEIEAPPEYKLLTDVRSVPVTLTEENGTTVVKYSISGEDADNDTEGTQIANEKPLIDIGVEKTWLNEYGDPLDAGEYSATFKLHRNKYWTEIQTEEGEPEKTSKIQIGYYDAYGYSAIDPSMEYDFVAGSRATITFDYDNQHDGNNNNYRQYKIGQNGSTNNLSDSGSFDVTMPSEGETVVVYMFDGFRNNNYWHGQGKYNAFTSLSVTGQDPQNTVIEREVPMSEEPDAVFEAENHSLTLSNGATSGKFESGLYLDEGDNANKFPCIGTGEENGKKVTYTYKYYITEEPVAGFTSSPAQAGYSEEEDFTGQFENRKILSAQVEKKWQDKDGAPLTSDLPDSLKVYLIAEKTVDGEQHQEVYREVTLNAEGEWKASCTNLPATDNDGNRITYYWSEETLQGFHMISNETEGTLTTITNRKSEEYNPKTDYIGTKKWNDTGEDRPELTITLYSTTTPDDESSYAPVKDPDDPTKNLAYTWTSQEGDEWTYKFAGLPVFDQDGKVIYYKAVETTPDDYASTADSSRTTYTHGSEQITRITDCSELEHTIPNINLENASDLPFVAIKHGNRSWVWTPRPIGEEEQDLIKRTVSDGTQAMNISNASFKSGMPMTLQAGNGTVSFSMGGTEGKTINMTFSRPNVWSMFCYGSFADSYDSGNTGFTNTRTKIPFVFNKKWINEKDEQVEWPDDIGVTLSRTYEEAEAEEVVGTYTIHYESDNSRFTINGSGASLTLNLDDDTNTYIATSVPEGWAGPIEITISDGPTYSFKTASLPLYKDENHTIQYIYSIKESTLPEGYVVTYLNSGASSQSSDQEGVNNDGMIINKEHRTIDINIQKKDDKGNGLAGAVFTLQKKEGETYQPIKSITNDDAEHTQKYPDVSGVDENSQFTSTTGEVKIKNLPDGDYKLVEESAPAGYVITQKEISFTITNQKLSGDNIDGKVTFDDESVLITIVNETGAALPHTGGTGTTLMYIFGILLIGLTSADLVIRNRRRNII